MRKFWGGYRTEKDLREREEIARVREGLIETLRRLIRTCGHDGEAEYVRELKRWKQDIDADEIKERIRQYHAAVDERQSLDQEPL
jgi:hypothetical protein